MSFAENTTVAPEKTKAEIETLVTKYGASHYGTASTPGSAGITFVINGRMVRFAVPLPSREEMKVRLKNTTQRWKWSTIPDAVADQAADQAAHQETRRRWRCLLLSIKSKLEVSATGIESFEEAFLANIVTSDNMTVWERMKAESSGILLLEAAK